LPTANPGKLGATKFLGRGDASLRRFVPRKLGK
jgi:hypothetical protein